MYILASFFFFSFFFFFFFWGLHYFIFVLFLFFIKINYFTHFGVGGGFSMYEGGAWNNTKRAILLHHNNQPTNQPHLEEML